jgi:hypothetical protein
MSEEDDNKQKQKYHLAFVAIAGLLFGFNLCLWSFGISWFDYATPMTLFFTLLITLLAIIVLAFLIRKIRSKTCYVVTALLTVVYVVNFFTPVVLRMRQGAQMVQCMWRLDQLGKALTVYSKKRGGSYPDAGKWCTLLLEDGDNLSEDIFKCPAAENGRCHYAINPNCEPNSPNDVVLLFETKDGWNQSGGFEMLTEHNHGGIGCSVLLNDGSERFIRSEEVGQLKWKADPTNK